MYRLTSNWFKEEKKKLLKKTFVYEVFLKSWYQETPNDIQEEVMCECEYIEDAWIFLKENAENYMEYYPLTEIGIRLTTKYV